MHELTQKALDSTLETIKEWTTDIVRADRLTQEVQKHLPESTDGKSHYQFESDYGDLSLTLWEAEEVKEIGPFMRAIRLAGFERKGEKVMDSTYGHVTWNYVAKEGDEEVRMRIRVNLTQGEGAQCRYVEVGKREVPVMELLCGDELKKWDDAKVEDD